MAQVSNVDSDFSSEDPTLSNADEGKKKSLLGKVKDKAKGTVRKLKSKAKVGSGETDDLSTEGQDIDNDTEESSQESQSESRIDGQITASDETVSEKQNELEALGGKPEDNMLSSFARSGTSENSPLVAVPTSYSEPHTTFEEVMPPEVIEPTSVSEQAEESSSNLGNIPEAKDEEKQAVKEVHEGGPDSDINQGFKNTFQEKNLQAIDGLPRPSGFDINASGSFKSSDLEFLKNQDLADRNSTQMTEQDAEMGSRELPYLGPSDGTVQSSELDQDTERPHPTGTVAEFQDSMFSSHDTQDLEPNEPPANEALHADEIGTWSRGIEPEAEKSHPPGSVAEFQDSMFSSHDTQDLERNKPTAAKALHADEIGTSSRGIEPDVEESHPPGSVAEFQDRMFSSHDTQDLERNKPSTAEALHADEVGTWSRGIEPEVEKSHPPGSVAEFQDSMFSSHDTQDLERNKPSAAEALHADEIGTWSRGLEGKKSSGVDGDAEKVQHTPEVESDVKENMSSVDASDLKPYEADEPSSTDRNSEAPVGDTSREGESDDNPIFHEASRDLPSPALAGERIDDKIQETDGASAGVSEGSLPCDHYNMPITAELDAENFFDALSDDEAIPSQRSLDSDVSKDFNLDATAEYSKEEQALLKSVSSRLAAAKENSASNEGGHVTDGLSSLTSAFRSVVGSVGSRVGFGSSPPHNSLSEPQASSDTTGATSPTVAGFSVGSTAGKVSTWISKAMGGQSGDQESTETTKIEE